MGIETCTITFETAPPTIDRIVKLASLKEGDRICMVEDGEGATEFENPYFLHFEDLPETQIEVYIAGSQVEIFDVRVDEKLSKLICTILVESGGNIPLEIEKNWLKK